ncbi:MAG: hypothetical protein H6922_01520 [Pseudomonadaceae bacterium]|nr:hypothetical protein [Pseudomonadaceae bacterium]
MPYRAVVQNHPVSLDLLRNDPHYARLLERKQALEEELAEELGFSAVDWDGVKLLKRKKLALNEQLEAYLRAKGAVH